MLQMRSKKRSNFQNLISQWVDLPPLMVRNLLRKATAFETDALERAI